LLVINFSSTLKFLKVYVIINETNSWSQNFILILFVQKFKNLDYAFIIWFIIKIKCSLWFAFTLL